MTKSVSLSIFYPLRCLADWRRNVREDVKGTFRFVAVDAFDLGEFAENEVTAHLLDIGAPSADPADRREPRRRQPVRWPPFAVAAPVAKNIGHMEITLTLQDMDDLQTAKSQTVENRPAENEASASGSAGKVL